jgi:hypothetical protein
LVLKIRHFGKYFGITWRILRVAAEEGWRRSAGPIVWEMKKNYIQPKKREIFYTQ